MKKLITLSAVLLLFISSHAQDLGMFKFRFYPTIQIGFFSPGDVNDFIANDLESYSINSGTSDLIMNFTLGAGFGFRIVKFVELQLQGEYTFAPKMVVVTNGSNKSYYFNKYAGGAIVNFHIPTKPSFKHSFFIGGGLFYNHLMFEDYEANDIAPRVQIGISLRNNKFNPQILLAADLPKSPADNSENFELNYTSVRIGVNLNF